MSRLRILFAILALCLTLSGCGAPGPAAENEMTRGDAAETWMLCLYLCGSNLESKQGWATRTLNELTGAKLPDNVTVAVQTGGSREWQNDTVTGGGGHPCRVPDLLRRELPRRPRGRGPLEPRRRPGEGGLL